MPSFKAMVESKYLKKEDVDPEKIVTIKSFDQEMTEQRGETAKPVWIMYVQEFAKGLRLNATNLNSLDDIFLGQGSEYSVGRQVILWNNPHIELAGKIVGGIRIKALVHPTEASLPPPPQPPLQNIQTQNAVPSDPNAPLQHQPQGVYHVDDKGH